jgi:hypothetical protein
VKLGRLRRLINEAISNHGSDTEINFIIRGDRDDQIFDRPVEIPDAELEFDESEDQLWLVLDVSE